MALLPGLSVMAAQKPKIIPPKRPTIGLVLEGGGALGFAHIGAIEWLEAHHIPVDYVAGTSMGGLVGGLYAAGNSPDDIKSFVGRIHWPGVLSGQVPFQALSYRRKEDRLAYPNRLEFGLKHGISVPRGLNSGAAVGLLFDRTLMPYYDLKSFDDLPIPFRCVATEIVTGKKHVFDDGSLAQAMRATMSIPGMFAPVQHGDEIYSDGAAVDNLPVDVARAMGADIVIAVYLDTGPIKPESLSSPLAVAGRNVSIMVAANEQASMKNATVLIRADVSKFSATDFDKSSVIIPLGKEAAETQAAALEKYALDDADWKTYLANRNERRRTEVPVPQFVDVYGLKGAAQSEVAASFKKFVGKPVDTTAIEQTISDLEGTGTYSIINYNLIDENGKPGLLIRPRSKDYAPPFLNLGLTLLSNDSNDIQLGFGARATFLDVAGPRSELRIDGMVGQVAGFDAELYKSLTLTSRWFVAPHAYVTHSETGYYSGSAQLAQFKQRRNGLGVDVGYQFNARTELRAGEDYQWFGERRIVGNPIGQEFSLTPLVTSVRFQYLGQDEVMLPSRGSEIRSNFSYYTQRPNSSDGLSQLNVTTEHFIPSGKRGIIFGTASGGTSFGATNLGLAGFSLGGPLRLTAYDRGELLGEDYFLGQAGYLVRLSHLNPIFGDAIYAGGFYEIGKINGGNSGTPDVPNDGTAIVVMKTLIGPVYGGGSIGGSGHYKWYFGLGRIF
ncbi:MULTISPECIES: patatin-like phospholipase family protein [Acidobacteriaceae]|uniref:patatin-like phospholipase family protein n=1 Tax=Acidobacteriaceae TaxID=204434 RepID=UPI00131D015A|nr:MULTISPECIES: patatin-like phospholipase family protein [Acidobacteriaceae]MDW5267911.1 patatin-like phospholipase family protein [Edaphobacter sp.]